MKNIGIVLFEGAEELDVVGPYKVFAWAAAARAGFASVFTVAGGRGAVRCHKGMWIVPDQELACAPPLDVLVVPGGLGARSAAADPALLGYVREQAGRCEWVTSVCTGALLLLAAGPARGKRITTHWSAVERLRALGQAKAVLDDVRFVRDGNLVISAGVSAGIDMALWLVGQIAGDPAFAREVQKGIEYFPAPPYTAAA